MSSNDAYTIFAIYMKQTLMSQRGILSLIITTAERGGKYRF